MTTVSLLPSSTIDSTGVTAVGGASVHAVLADISDSSYVDVEYPSDRVEVGLDNLTLPAGAVVKSVHPRVRTALGGGSSRLAVSAYSTGYPSGGDAVVVTWGTAATIFVGAPTAGWNDAATDAATIAVAMLKGTWLRVYEIALFVTYVEQPVATVTGPTGTVTDSNRPSVTWTEVVAADGGARTHFEVKVFSAAQYGAGGFDPDTSDATSDSGVTASASASWLADESLPDATYRAYVRVAQTVNGAQHWSAWDYEAFTIDAPQPAVPDLLVTAQASAARVVIDLADNAGDATTTGFDIERSDDEGETWQPVRTTADETGRIAGTDVTVYDYEAPNGVTVTYRARALHVEGLAVTASDWTEATTTWESTQWWLKHPSLPALNMPVEMFSYSAVNRAARQSSQQPVGAVLPVVISDTRGGETGTVVVYAFTQAERDAFNAILDTTATLLLHGPVADGHPDRYIRVGDQSSERVVDKSFAHITRETLPWTLVAAPLGAQTGEQYVPATDDEEELIIA